MEEHRHYIKLMLQNEEECPFMVDTVQRTEDNFRETLVMRWKGCGTWDIADCFDILEEDEEADDEEEEGDYREMEEDLSNEDEDIDIML